MSVNVLNQLNLTENRGQKVLINDLYDTCYYDNCTRKTCFYLMISEYCIRAYIIFMNGTQYRTRNQN